MKMNTKNFSLGLTLVGLGFVTLTPKAQAFQFSYLNSYSSSTAGLFDFNFEFQADPGDTVSTGQSVPSDQWFSASESGIPDCPSNK
jgi:hypothetical protein